MDHPKFYRTLENSVIFGFPLIIEELELEIDPILEPLLLKSFTKEGSNFIVKVGDNEVTYNENFKLYMITQL